MPTPKNKGAPSRAPAAKPKAAPAPPAPKTDVHVKVGAHNVRLGSPPSMALRFDVLNAVGTNEGRANAAALGLCWESGGTSGAPAKWAQYGYNTLAYGGAVLDELVKRGVSIGEIANAGYAAFLHLTAALPTGGAVQAAEDFTGAQPEG